MRTNSLNPSVKRFCLCKTSFGWSTIQTLLAIWKNRSSGTWCGSTWNLWAVWRRAGSRIYNIIGNNLISYMFIDGKREREGRGFERERKGVKDRGWLRWEKKRWNQPLLHWIIDTISIELEKYCPKPVISITCILILVFNHN